MDATAAIHDPHLRRLFDLRARLGSAISHVPLSEAALDKQVDAIFVVNAAGQILLMNCQAEALIAQHDPLSLTRVGLRTSGQDARPLRDAITTACARVGSQGAALCLGRAAGLSLVSVAFPPPFPG